MHGKAFLFNSLFSTFKQKTIITISAQGFRGIQATKKATIVIENLHHVIENIRTHFGHSHLECDSVKPAVRFIR